MHKHKGPTVWSAFAMASGIGLQLAAAIVVGAVGGRWLDDRLACFPVFTVAGVVLGVVTGLWSIYKKIRSSFF